MSRKWLVSILSMLMIFGLAYKVLKHNAPHIAIDSSVNAFGFELNPFSASPAKVSTQDLNNSANVSKAKNFMKQTNALAGIPGEFSFGGEPIKGDAKAPANAKKKRLEDAKKRAAARKRIQERRQQAWNDYLKALAEKSNEQSDAPTAQIVQSNQLVGSVTPPVKEKEEDSAQEIYQYWSNILLGEANFQQLTQFISEYQTSKIPEEVYFQITQEMLFDSREQISQQGLAAANAAPSTRSFTLVSSFMEQAPAGNTVRVKANVDLRTIYKSLSHLSSISGVLRSATNSFALSLSSQILQQMAQENLQTPVVDPIDPNQVQTASISGESLEKFKNLIPLLEQLANSSTDQTVSESALLAAQEIQKYI